MRFSPILHATVVIFLQASCGRTPVEDLPVRVEPDLHFNELFSPDSGGITGADGLFSILLPDGRSVFLTGDCFLGQVVNNRRDVGTKMLNNSMVVISKDGSEAIAMYNGTYDQPESLFVPEQEGEIFHWYWPDQQDEVDKLAENQWTFAVDGVDLLRFSLPDLHYIGFDSIVSTYDLDIHLGNCVLRDGGHIYFYGTRNDPDGSHIYVARIKAGNTPYHQNWEYFDGHNWSEDHHEARPMKLDISVSEQFSIFRIKDRYVLLTHRKSTPDIYTFTSREPHRGFGNKTFIYRSPDPEADETGNLSAYNALAHPQYTDQNMLLVSYCVNSLRVRDVFEDADNYRGRFIRVPLSMIDSSF